MKSPLFKTSDGKNYAFPFTLIATLFFLWGFCHGLMDVLNRHFQTTLHLTKAESAMVQFVGYMGYFLMAIPAGWIARRLGYKGGILVGLILIAIGALWFVPATHIGTFAVYLAGLFTIFIGLASLETVANPYATVLGPPEMGAARINLAQSCNSIGWLLGPLVGSWFLFRGDGNSSADSALQYPYLGIGTLVIVLIVVFAKTHLPEVKAEDAYHDYERKGVGHFRALWSHSHFIGAVIAQFLYVAAQIGIFAFFINYMVSETPNLAAGSWLPGDWTVRNSDGALRISDFGAAHIFSFGGFFLLFLGRFLGGFMLKAVPAHRLLALWGIISAVLMGLMIARLGWISATALVLSFFFMSIMFPTIFALGLHALGPQTKRASSFIVMSIVGGALAPVLMGHIADLYSMTTGFLVPLVCFAAVALYGILWPALSGSKGLTGVSTSGGH